MRRQIAPEDLARDGRFHRITTVERFSDPRPNAGQQFMDPRSEDVADRARGLMHGIFTGEIQALEGAGRTCFDYDAPDDVPFALKLDMARQCWDEARHCEISVKLGQHMGSEIGEFFESTTRWNSRARARRSGSPSVTARSQVEPIRTWVTSSASIQSSQYVSTGSPMARPKSRIVVNTSMARPSRARFTPARRKMGSSWQAA